MSSIPPVSPDGQSVEIQLPQLVQANAHLANAAPQVKQARDRAQYVRQQRGHSWIVWWLILGPITLWIPAVYYSVSPNHYWHI